MRLTTLALVSGFLLKILEMSATSAVATPPSNDADWSSLNTDVNEFAGTDRMVFATVVDSSGNLYIGGDFIVAGAVVANRVAKWDGAKWSGLGAGMNGAVRAVAVSGNNLYAAGDFTTAGGAPANRIARWNGTSWSALASGLNGPVQALAVSDGNLFAGGRFTTAGGVSAKYIAKWDGSGWSALATGMGNEDPFSAGVYALAVSSRDLYAGGNFTIAGGAPARNIAKWNGSSWSPLGSGLGDSQGNPSVQALAASGANLYAGGRFTTANGSQVNYIAQWDGNAWTGLGSGTAAVNVQPPDVTALAVSGADLYAGGYFETVDGVKTGFIAKWNGSNWGALGSGLGEPSWAGGANLFALAVSATDVYAGGDFAIPDGPGKNIARWNGSSWSALGATALSILRTGNELTISWPTSFGEFVLQRNSDVTNAREWSDSVYSVTTNGAIRSVTVSISSGNQFFRLKGK